MVSHLKVILFYIKILGINEVSLFSKIKNGKYKIPEYISNNVRSLINDCLIVSVENRPSCDEVIF